MITLQNLKAFKDTLDILNVELTELIKVRSEQKLFANSDDYYNALKICEFYPQDYFKMRLFDYDICLHYSNRSKQFYIKIDSVKGFDLSNYCFSELFKNYNLKSSPQGDKLYINNDNDFKTVSKIFGTFLKCFISYYFSQDKLFAYEL